MEEKSNYNNCDQLSWEQTKGVPKPKNCYTSWVYVRGTNFLSFPSIISTIVKKEAGDEPEKKV